MTIHVFSVLQGCGVYATAEQYAASYEAEPGDCCFFDDNAEARA